MNAIVQSAYGSPDSLELREVAVPAPAANEVLVRIDAAAVNPVDWHHVRGEPYVMRLQFGLHGPTVRRRGFDLAGQVETVGTDVTEFEPGDDVYGLLDFGDPTIDDGAFAEYACVPVDQLARMPDTLPSEEAAALPLAGLTRIRGESPRLQSWEEADKGQHEPRAIAVRLPQTSRRAYKAPLRM